METWTGNQKESGKLPGCVWGMSLVCRETEQHRSLMSRLKRALASTAIAAALVTSAWIGLGTPAISGGETRTISLYHIHTGESLTVTYMVDGRYVPSAMKKINYLLRDWRRDQVITIDPKTIDLVWELHADLGSHAPVHIVCGYRSAATNSFLHSIGRNVARQSQHILGKAIDIYFPDVPTIKMRNSALVRQAGGVGYYRSAGGPTGFLHVDSGHVRHWGPGIGAREMAQIFRDYRRTIGARINGNDRVMVADSNSNSPSQQDKSVQDKKPDLADNADEGGNGALASLSERASQVPQAAKPKLAETAQVEPAVVADPIPRPRPKPIEVLMMAAVNMKIQPVSSPPERQTEKRSPVADSMGVVVAASTMVEPSVAEPVSNSATKVSLAEALLDGTSSDVPVIKMITASAGGDDISWWPQQIIYNSAEAIRRDGTPAPFTDAGAGMLPGSAEAAEPANQPMLAAAAISDVAGGKTGLLVVNRQGKGDLLMPMPPGSTPRQRVGQLLPQ